MINYIRDSVFIIFVTVVVALVYHMVFGELKEASRSQVVEYDMTMEEYLSIKSKEDVPHEPKSEPVDPKRVAINFCENDPECYKMAEALVYESRNQSLEGQIAVASVILNRVENPRRWPNTIIGVIEDKHQFSYLKDMWQQSRPTKEDWKKAYFVAFNMINGIWEKNTTADHYLNPNAVSRMPNWTRKYQRVVVIDSHHFYLSI